MAHLEDLCEKAQHRLLEVLEVGVGTWMVSQGRAAASVRILASIRTDLAHGRHEEALGERLLSTLGFHRAELTPLAQRREDVKFLIEHFLHRYHVKKAKAKVSKEVLTACMNHDWPGDRMELARTVARLAALAGSATLVETKHLQELGSRYSEGPSSPQCEATLNSSAAAAARLLTRSSWAHPALRSAVGFMVRHDSEELSLSRVAAVAHVSESYLSRLFRENLGITFTDLRAALRVERAKKLIEQNPWGQVISVASQAGFTSLRQLERTFKKFAGCTASCYRNRLRQSRAVPKI